MFERSVTELTKLGLAEYEARAYVGLVGLGEGTARQVHEACGVPRPRIYDILDSLEQRGFVEVWPGKPKYYRAVPPDRLMRVLREGLEESMHIASEELMDLSLEARHRSFPVWHIKGELSIQDQIRVLFDEVGSELIVMCNKTSYFRSMIKDLREVGERGVGLMCMVPEGANAFSQALPSATVVDLHMDKSAIAEMYSKLITGKLQTADDVYRAEMLIIADEMRSLLVYEVNGERTAIIFELPIITFLQHSTVKRMIEEAGNR